MSHSIAAQAGEPQGRGRSRRWFLAGAGAVVISGGGGVGVALSSDRSARKVSQPPAELLDTIEVERQLIADLDATTGGSFAVRRAIRQSRADHAEHLRTLQALVTMYGDKASDAGAAPSSSAKPSRVRGTPRTRTQLHSAEGRASAAAVSRAAALSSGQAQLATLLASIAACEASHADLLR